MVRDVTGLRTGKNSSTVNVKPNWASAGAVHVTPKALPEKTDKKDHEPEDHNAKDRLPDEFNEKQDVLGIKSTNHEPEEKIPIKADAQKSADTRLSPPGKPALGSAVTRAADANSFELQAPDLKGDRQSPGTNHVIAAENSDSGVKFSCKSIDSPNSDKKSQPNSPSISTKQQQPRIKFYHEEEDNWSLASSATSVRTAKSKITVPVAPRFTCVDRLERRKEFYTKLEEKHRALEKEKIEYVARTKEEEQAAIKQLRKSMAYKANPVPSFYREGPPPKVELKKLPVTRAKSPNLTRRKSFGDAVKSSPDDKVHSGRAARHSVGAYKQGKNSPSTPKSNDPNHVRKSNRTTKIKGRPKELKETQVKETTEECCVKELRNAGNMKELENADMTKDLGVANVKKEPGNADITAELANADITKGPGNADTTKGPGNADTTVES